jgi:hypothetical protein
MGFWSWPLKALSRVFLFYDPLVLGDWGKNSFSSVNSMDKMVLEVTIVVLVCADGQTGTVFAELDIGKG